MMRSYKILIMVLAIMLAGCSVQGKVQGTEKESAKGGAKEIAQETKRGDKLDEGKIQNKRKFEDVFKDRTLRVDYYREGNRKRNDVKLAGYRDNQSPWAGSMTQMLDPFDNGQYRIVVREASTGEVIYSRCYNSIFQEYCSTPEGADSIVKYEEVVKVPWPTVAVVFEMQERGDDLLFRTQAEWKFDPERQRQLPPTSRPQPMGQRQPQRPEAVKLHTSGDVHRKMDIVIVPEGYGVADSAKMMEDFQQFVSFIFSNSPFKERKEDFNIYGVKVFGRESGISNPKKGVHVQSAVGASYNTFGAERYLMTFNLFKLHDCLAGLPCDQIIIMANSDIYGGGAIYNFYAISSLSKRSEHVLTHELGHSIGGLADEYVDEALSYGDMLALTHEPIEPNITTLVNFESKWKTMMANDSTLGTYEGAGYHAKGIYRPTPHCMIRDYAPFCPVCTRRLNEIFDLYCR